MSTAVPHPQRGPRWGRRIVVCVVVLALAAIALVVAQLERPLPRLSVSVVLPPRGRAGGAAAVLPWPRHGSAAVEVRGVGLLGSFNGDRATPLASVTKLVTALVVLRAHPLAAGESGPAIRLRPADVATYESDLAGNQSVLKVEAGEELSERQALEGLLVASANNVADILARWDAGTTSVFVGRMNAMARALGLRRTHFVEPSGLSPGNVGSAIDMTRLGADALANPTIAAIVRLGEVALPVAGIVINYDYAVGHHGIIGIKTGSSNAAGGNFVFAAREVVDGRTLTAVGAVLAQKGTSNLDAALAAGERLANAALRVPRTRVLLTARTPVVRVSAPWAKRTVVARTGAAVSVFGAPGGEPSLRARLVARLRRLRHVERGQRLATVTVSLRGRSYTVAAAASGSIPRPGLVYRLTRMP
jgi:D-alanyl-D-alanine carboxypeptidase (penicillin-binding protein 5/6)